MLAKINFTPGAERQLHLVSHLDSVKTGFASGIQIGKYVIIEHLFPVNFAEENIDKVYLEVFNKMGDKLIGPFFKNEVFLNSEWFIGDIIIKIKGKKSEFYLYEEINPEAK